MADRRTPCARGGAAPRRLGRRDPSGGAGRPLHHGRRPAVVVGEADRAGHPPQRQTVAWPQVRRTPDDTAHPGRLTPRPQVVPTAGAEPGDPDGALDPVRLTYRVSRVGWSEPTRTTPTGLRSW